MPVGFKNGTDGGVQIAIDAIRAAAHPHRFIGVTEQGLAGIVSTAGNPDCHVILRGGATGPNYDAIHVQKTLAALRDAGLPPRVMIDASHGNSEKDHRRQPIVVRDVAAQVAQGEAGIIGIMMESFLVDGRQDLVDASRLVYGQSITDACMGWDVTDAGAPRAGRRRPLPPHLVPLTGRCSRIAVLTRMGILSVRRSAAVVKQLTRTGNSLALVLDKPLLDHVGIDATTPLEMSTDGHIIVIFPVRDRRRRTKVKRLAPEAHQRYGGVFRRLAE